MLPLVLLLLLLSPLPSLSQCTSLDTPHLLTFQPSFFACYDSNPLTVGSSCFTVTPSCSTCIQDASTCVQASCASPCAGFPKTTACLSCSSANCNGALGTCSQIGLKFTVPCEGFFECQPAWVLGVVIGGSAFGGVVLLGGLFWLWTRRKSAWGESEACGFPACCMCCEHTLRDGEQVEARLRMQNKERLAMLKQKGTSSNNGFDYARNNAGGSNGRKTVDTGTEFPHMDDTFEMSSPVGNRVMSIPSPKNEEDDVFNGRTTIVVTTEHNVRASRLPDDFRKSFRPTSLTPEMIFNMQTVNDMKNANANALPAAVMASHKAMKMMGITESEVQKPFSESVTARVERLAKVASAQGYGSGAATAGLGNDIAVQFAIKRKAAEERADQRRKMELAKEEDKIRKEIRQENIDELQERRRTLRASQKLSEADTKHLADSLKARSSGKRDTNKMSEFLKKNAADDV